MGVVNVFILPIAAVVCSFLSSRMPKTEKNVTAMRLKIPTFLLMLPIALAAVIAVCVIGLQSSPIAWVLLALLLYVAGAVWDDARQKKLQHMAAGVSGNNGRQNHGIIMKYQMMQPLVSSAAIAGMFFYGAYAIRDMIGTGGLFWIFAIVAIVFAGTFIYTLAGFVDYLRYGYSKDFAIKFYNACKQQNLLDSEDDVTVQRMVNLAQNHFGKIVIKAETSAVLLFEEGKKIVDGDKITEQHSKARSECIVAKKKFIEEKNAVEPFAEYTGRDKRIAMLKREQEIEADIAEKQYGQSASLRAASKGIKEKNRMEFYGEREELITKGYAPCKNCNP
jgi:hypothetical protein